jgi:hypothetical protein
MPKSYNFLLLLFPNIFTMKNTKPTFAILIFLFLGLGSAKSQNLFELKELENLCSYSSFEFDTYVLQKGYSFQGAISDEETKVYRDDYRRANGRRDQISRSVSSTEPLSLGLTTTSKQFFINLKMNIASEGFKQIKEENIAVGNNTTTFYYLSNSKFTIVLCSYTANDGMIMYSLQISKN